MVAYPIVKLSANSGKAYSISFIKAENQFNMLVINLQINSLLINLFAEFSSWEGK
jgi:hypothetical protein